MKVRSLGYGLGCVCLVLWVQLFAEAGQTDQLSRLTLYGIDGSSGLLLKYQIAKQAAEPVGHIHLKNKPGAVTGIEGAVYIPGHLNIMGFWNDFEAGQTKLIYINRDTAEATVVEKKIESGRVTAATVAGLVEQNGGLKGRMAPMSGHWNINPNDDPNNIFVLDDSRDGQIDAAMLHNAPMLDDKGVYRDGQCTEIWVQAKGDGSQNTLIFDGRPFELKNGHLYHVTFTDGPMPYVLRNDHVNGNGQAIGQWWMECTGEVDGIITDLADSGVYALQTIEAGEDQSIEFAILGGSIASNHDVAAKITVLGASSGPGVHVTLRPSFNGNLVEPFGDVTDAVKANVHDENNPRHYVTPRIHASGTEITIEANSWLGVHGGGYRSHIHVDSSKDSSNVLVLRHGEQVPGHHAFTHPQIHDYLREYVDLKTGKIVLNENQVIYLFELTTTDLSSSGADFDDLAVLVTLASKPVDLIQASAAQPIG